MLLSPRRGSLPVASAPQAPREVARQPQHIHILLGYASRFDKANAGQFVGPARDFIEETLGSIPYSVGWLNDPKIDARATHILLAGDDAGKLANIAIANRGLIITYKNLPATLTFHPQDCVDAQDYESLEEDDEDDADGDGKDAATTRRANYRFWFRAHFAKLLSPPRPATDKFSFNTCDIARLPLPRAGSILYLDIETHPSSSTMQCLSIAIDDGPVLSQTVYDYNGRLVAPGAALARWLVRAFALSTVVAHNAVFDTLFLAHYHGIRPPDKIHDTMLLWHRLFPEADKSLAHLISYFTNEPYHKDQSGTFYPRNVAQQLRLLRYNSRDVYTLRLIYRGLLAHWNASFQQVAESQPDYLFAGYRGFSLDTARRDAHKRRLNTEMTGLERMLRVLTGRADLNARSNQQIAAWLYDGLEYKVLRRTDAGAPAVDTATLYKLIIQHPGNVGISTLLHHRKVSKQLQMLNFEPLTCLGKR